MPDPVLHYIRTGQYDAAATLCEQAIVADPECLSHYWYLGLVRWLQADQEAAQEVWCSAMAVIDPMTVAAGLEELLNILQAEAERQLQLGQPHLAEQLSWQALELDATRSDSYLQLGCAVALQGQLDEAIEYWQRAIELQPNAAEAYEYQAEVFQKLEQWDSAIEAYSQTIALQPTWKAHYYLGICLGKQQHWQAALEHLTQAIQLQPDFAPAYGDRGWAGLQRGNWVEALTDFRMAVLVKSHYAQTYQDWVKRLAPLVCSSAMIQRANVLQQLCLPDPEMAYRGWRTVGNRQTSPNCQNLTALDRLTNPSEHPYPALTPPNPASSAPGVPWSIHCYETTATWAETQRLSDCYIELDPPGLVELNLPKTIDRQADFSFRFGQTLLLPATFVATVPDGIVWLNDSQTSSAVLTAEQQLLGDLSPEFPLLSPGHPDKQISYHSFLLLAEISPLQRIDGTVAVCSGLTNDMYFHWMLDTLPRLNLLQRSGINFDRIDYFLISHHLPFHQETLDLLGLPETKILETAQHLHIQANQLIVPSYPSSPAWAAPWVCQWLRNVFLTEIKSKEKGHSRLYITRQHTTNRRVINEQEIIDLLSQFGFQCVALESLSVLEQASQLAKAEVIVSPHGGGLTNIVFCQPGTKIIEIFSPNYVYHCYWFMSNLLNLEYYYLIGVLPTGVYLNQFLYPDARTEDIWVNLEDLRKLLKLASVS